MYTTFKMFQTCFCCERPQCTSTSSPKQAWCRCMQRCAGVCRTTRVLESDKGADAAYSVAAHVMPVSHCSWFRVHRVDSHAVLQMCLHLMHNGAYAGHVMVEYGRVNVMPEVMPLFFHASCRVRRISDEQPHSQDVTHRRRVAHGINERLDIRRVLHLCPLDEPANRHGTNRPPTALYHFKARSPRILRAQQQETTFNNRCH